MLFAPRSDRRIPNVSRVILGRTPKLLAPVVAGLAVTASAVAGQAATAMSPAWPTTSAVVYADRNVTGTVDGSVHRVTLQQKVAGGWRSVASDVPDASGAWAIKVPTWWLGSRQYRVVDDAGAASAETSFAVRPGYTPSGRATQFRYLMREMSRWNPCQPIGWRVNTQQATPGALRDARIAFAKLTQATGFRFVYRGSTGIVPQWEDTENSYPADTQIVIAWARKSQSSLFRFDPSADAFGNPYYIPGYRNGDGTPSWRIASGGVVIDSRLKVKAGYGTGITRGDLLLHELGHVMGLDHFDSGGEMMNPVMTFGVARYGRGDLAGFEQRGAELGCLIRDS